MEEWKDIEWLEWVEVSSYGRVRRILTQSKSNKWYMVVTISDWKTFSKQFKVSRLVAAWFHGLDLKDKDRLACHKDDNPSNNYADNIFVWTHADNMQDMYEKSRWSWPCKLDQEKVIQIRKKRLEWYSYKNLAIEFWVHHTTIRRICDGITW